MESLPTSDLAFWSASGAPLPAPVEWESGWVEVGIPQSAWEVARLWRNGVALPLTVQRLSGRSRVLAAWPLSGPGNYRLRLEPFPDADAVEATVTVRPRKIGPGAFEALLSDLEARLPASVALGLQRCGGLAGVEILPPRENTCREELQRLRTAVLGDGDRPGLSALLPRIARDPHQVLRYGERWVRGAHARRPNPARLAQAVARPGNLGSDSHPAHVLDVHTELGVDVYENRLVLAYCNAVRLRLRQLGQFASDPAVRSVCGELQSALETARRRAPFLDEVRAAERLPHPVSMVLLKRPEYRAVLQGFLALQRGVGVRLRDGTLAAPLENLPSLYQTWCTLEIVDALLAAAGDAGYVLRNEQLVHPDRSDRFVRVLRDGHPVIVLVHPETEAVVTLTPERRFPRRRHGPYYSAGFEQRPDITVEVQPPRTPARLYLFDPKYKLDGDDDAAGGPKKADIDKMHTYRDAIRYADVPDDATGRPVQFAAILYPGPRTRFGPGVAALQAMPGADTLPAQLLPILRAALSSAISPPSAISPCPLFRGGRGARAIERGDGETP